MCTWRFLNRIFLILNVRFIAPGRGNVDIGVPSYYNVASFIILEQYTSL